MAIQRFALCTLAGWAAAEGHKKKKQQKQKQKRQRARPTRHFYIAAFDTYIDIDIATATLLLNTYRLAFSSDWLAFARQTEPTQLRPAAATSPPTTTLSVCPPASTTTSTTAGPGLSTPPALVVYLYLYFLCPTLYPGPDEPSFFSETTERGLLAFAFATSPTTPPPTPILLAGAVCRCYDPARSQLVNRYSLTTSRHDRTFVTEYFSAAAYTNPPIPTRTTCEIPPARPLHLAATVARLRPPVYHHSTRA
ncbi:hypothetical protein PG997_009070 [Apiospora hydei]|uniref:Uncharacterized protein n=1 Tax=Apiospora hydei TaxID=1337664 RepID=A0ABR1VUB1_9PEZI